MLSAWGNGGIICTSRNSRTDFEEVNGCAGMLEQLLVDWTFVLLGRNEPLYRTAPTLNSAGVLHHPPHHHHHHSPTARTCTALRLFAEKLPVVRADAGRHMRSDGRTEIAAAHPRRAHQSFASSTAAAATGAAPPRRYER